MELPCVKLPYNRKTAFARTMLISRLASWVAIVCRCLVEVRMITSIALCCDRH